MPKTSKVKKKVTKAKTKTVTKVKPRLLANQKRLARGLLKFPKHIFQKKLKNICAKNIRFSLE